MKIQSALVFWLLMFFQFAQAQPVSKPLGKVMTLEMPGEDGTNGAGVVWHPVQKKYYSSFAGNITYPFAVFSSTGTLLSSEDQEALFDVRGLWYNPATKGIESNGYSDFGWIRYKMDKNGMLVDTIQFVEGQNQPDEQSVGSIDVLKKMICFLDKGTIVFYSLKGVGQEEVLELEYNKTSQEGNELAGDNEEEPFHNYNKTTVCFTGIPNAEFGLLNISDRQIELYNRKGKMTKILTLPEDAPVNDQFNFAYSNATWWLFDTDLRTWTGYK